MPKLVELPDGRVIEFPDDMNDKQIDVNLRLSLARDQGVSQAEAGATQRSKEALANPPMSPFDAATAAAMSGEGGAFADPNATGEDILKRGAGMAATAGAVGTGAGLISAPVATMKGLAGGLLGSAAGSEAGQWVGRRVPLVGGETAGNVLGALGGLVGGGVGGAVAPKLGRDQLLAMLPGKGGMLGSLIGGGESAAAKGAATQAAKATAPVVSREAELKAALLEGKLADQAAKRARDAELHQIKMERLKAPRPPKAGPRAVPKAEPKTEGATALKPEPEMIPDEAVSIAPEPEFIDPSAVKVLPFPQKGQTTMPTNLGGKAKAGPAPTPPDKLEETLRASLDAIAEKKASKGALQAIAEKVETSPLQVPRIQVGAQRVGRQVGMTKEEVRQQAGPVLDEVRGEASPILPIEPFRKIIDTMKAIPPAEREAYVARATSGKAKAQIENIRRTLEHLGLLVPAGVAAGTMTE